MILKYKEFLNENEDKENLEKIYNLLISGSDNLELAKLFIQTQDIDKEQLVDLIVDNIKLPKEAPLFKDFCENCIELAPGYPLLTRNLGNWWITINIHLYEDDYGNIDLKSEYLEGTIELNFYEENGVDNLIDYFPKNEKGFELYTYTYKNIFKFSNYEQKYKEFVKSINSKKDIFKKHILKNFDKIF